MTDKTSLHFYDLWKAYGYTGKGKLAKVYSLDENAFLVLFNVEENWKVGVIDGDCFTILYAGNETDATSFYENF